jgi:hypothetical protein
MIVLGLKKHAFEGQKGIKLMSQKRFLGVTD